MTQPARERRPTRNGVGIRTATGWTWLCNLCHHVLHLGMDDGEDLDVPLLLDAMDEAHWCWKKGVKRG